MLDAEQVGDAGAHFAGDGRDFGRGQNQRGVDVDDAVAGVLQLFEREVEKDGGVGVFPARIAGRKEAADVARGHGAQQRVGNGVQQHVAVGVAGQALGVVQRHAADAQRHAGLEFVRVIAKSDACVHRFRALRLACGLHACRPARARDPAVVIALFSWARCRR